jgi:hypothetical protein
VFKGEKTTFDPNTRNRITGKPINKSHHAAGEGAKTKSSYDDGVYAFCLVHVTDLYKGIPFRCRCGESMLVDSDQCSKHGKAVYKDGANQVWEKFLKPGNKYRVTYGDIKDRAPIEQPLSEAERRAQAKLRAQAEVDALAEQLNDAVLNGQDTTELVSRQVAAETAVTIAGRSRLPVEAPAPVAAPSAGFGNIYKSGRSANAKMAGDRMLDEKAKRNPNNRKKGSRWPQGSRSSTNLPPVAE